jgi:steroid delta-isomerase-like uncharacterized protein
VNNVDPKEVARALRSFSPRPASRDDAVAVRAASVRDAVDRGTAAFNAHDMDAFAETVSDDVVLIAPGRLRATGKAAWIEFFSNWIEAFPDAHVDVHDLVVTDDVAMKVGTFSGTHDGVFHTSLGDIPPTGNAVRAEYVQVLRYRDGKFVSSHLMFDRLELLVQLGLVPAPGPA